MLATGVVDEVVQRNLDRRPSIGPLKSQKYSPRWAMIKVHGAVGTGISSQHTAYSVTVYGKRARWAAASCRKCMVNPPTHPPTLCAHTLKVQSDVQLPHPRSLSWAEKDWKTFIVAI